MCFRVSLEKKQPDVGNAHVKMEEAWIEQRKKTQEWRKDRQRKTEGEMSLKRQELIMKSKEQLEELTVDWRITPFPFLGDSRQEAGVEKGLCRAGEGRAPRGKCL